MSNDTFALGHAFFINRFSTCAMVYTPVIVIRLLSGFRFHLCNFLRAITTTCLLAPPKWIDHRRGRRFRRNVANSRAPKVRPTGFGGEPR
jgi:hypothetical protein